MAIRKVRIHIELLHEKSGNKAIMNYYDTTTGIRVKHWRK